jgi:NADPH:quinone reductase-like Zn-dependent oxidoreductase
MRAVLLTGHGDLDKLVYREDVPVPVPAPGEVLVKVGACGVNNTDINLRIGWYAREQHPASLTQDPSGGSEQATDGTPARNTTWQGNVPAFPRIQGAAVAGRIVNVSVGVDASRIGERVLIDPQIRDPGRPPRAQLKDYLGGDRDGGFAEYVAVPSQNAHAVRTPLSDAELATFPTSYDTAEEMLERAHLGAGERVLITGAAGGVGTALIQLARIRGAVVIAVASSSKEERLRSLGVDHFFTRESIGLGASIDAEFGREGIDVVADVVGGELFSGLLKRLCRGGRYVTAGAIGGPIQQIDLRDLIYKDLEMNGVTCPTANVFQRIVDLVSTGQLQPLVDRTFGLRDLWAAQHEFLKRRHIGKFVIVP